eukprot:Awhi_evm1s11234
MIYHHFSICKSKIKAESNKVSQNNEIKVIGESGGTTDVGIHTGCIPRDTAWGLVMIVVLAQSCWEITKSKRTDLTEVLEMLAQEKAKLAIYMGKGMELSKCTFHPRESHVENKKLRKTTLFEIPSK